MENNDNIIECRGLTKVYRTFWGRKTYALKGLDLVIKKGSIFGLLGPNGSGKTTFFKILMGFIQNFSGRFVIMGSPNGLDLSIKERIGFLPENPAIYEDLNAYEALKFYTSFFKSGKVSSRANIERLIELVGLTAHRKKKVKEFSKGMKQRLVIAQTISNDPDLLIMDELTSGLDPFVTEEINQIIHGLKDQGKTIILSSHLLGHIQDVSDTIGILFNGELLKVGTLKEITQVEDTGHAVFKTGGKSLKECRDILENSSLEFSQVDFLNNDLEESFKNIVKRKKEQ